MKPPRSLARSRWECEHRQSAAFMMRMGSLCMMMPTVVLIAIGRRGRAEPPSLSLTETWHAAAGGRDEYSAPVPDHPAAREQVEREGE